MQPITLLGFAAGILTTFSFAPQVHRAWRTKRCDDLSMGMLLTFASGIFLWLVYGISLRAVPIIAANAATVIQVLMIIILKARYRRSAPVNAEG